MPASLFASGRRASSGYDQSRAAMDRREEEAVCDTLYVTKPNRLASVLVLASLGVAMEAVDV